MQLKIFAPCFAALFFITTSAAYGQPKQVANKSPTAADVLTTPLTDLNIKKGEIPKKLADAQANPYSLVGLEGCASLISEVQVFDALLGDDIDLPHGATGGLKAGKVGQAVVGMFIPYRGIIRQVSGASKQEKKLAEAISAGQIRRGFLKGIGYSRGCPHPARPANDSDVARIQAERENTRR